MKNKIIIDENKKYLKGNLHVHTNASDGKYSVEDVCQKYGSMGYDFLAITDHNVVYKGSNFVNGMLVVPGVEVACTYNGEIDYKKGSYSHFNLIGILNSEYDVNKAYALKYIDDTYSVIQGLDKNDSCNIVPIISVSKENLK